MANRRKVQRTKEEECPLLEERRKFGGVEQKFTGEKWEFEVVASHWLQARTAYCCHGKRKSSFLLLDCESCDECMTALPSWLPDSNFELIFNTFAQLTTSNLNAEGSLKRTKHSASVLHATCPRTLLKETIQWNLEEINWLPPRPQGETSIRVNRGNCKNPWCPSLTFRAK